MVVICLKKRRRTLMTQCETWTMTTMAGGLVTGQATGTATVTAAEMAASMRIPAVGSSRRVDVDRMGPWMVLMVVT